MNQQVLGQNGCKKYVGYILSNGRVFNAEAAQKRPTEITLSNFPMIVE